MRILLIILVSLFAYKAQAQITEQFIGTTGNRVVARGQFKADSLLILASHDTSGTANIVAAVCYKNGVPYYYNGTKWSGFGGATVNLDSLRTSTTVTISNTAGTGAVIKLVDIGSNKAGMMSPVDKGRLDSLYLGLLSDTLVFMHAGNTGQRIFFVRNDSTFFKRINATGATIATNADSSITISFASAATPGVTNGGISNTDYAAFQAKTSSFAPVTTGFITKWAADVPPQMTNSVLSESGSTISMVNGTVFDFNGVKVGPSVFSGANAALTANGAVGLIWLADGNAAANGKVWDFVPGGTNFFMRLVNDAYNFPGDTIWKYQRSGLTLTYGAFLKGILMVGTDADNSSGAKVQVKGQISAEADSASSPTGGYVFRDAATGKFKITGTPGGTLTSGEYTPTLTNVTNVTASLAYVCQYTRVGNIVTVYGRADIDPNTTGTVHLGVSLPVASNFSDLQDLHGLINCLNVQQSGILETDVTNDRADVVFTCTDTNSTAYHFSFQYKVIP